jgi:acyl transferase domain-containing protein
MAQTEVAQPANFALQVALADLWRAWGIVPDAIVGHSAGEVAGAYVAGTLSLEAAVRVIFHRSRLQQRTTGTGMMAAAGLSAQEGQDLVAAYPGRLSIAAINGPGSVTLSGDAGGSNSGSVRLRVSNCSMLSRENGSASNTISNLVACDANGGLSPT